MTEAAEILNDAIKKWGVATVLAIGLTWFLATITYKQLESIHTELHDHITQAGFYMRQTCINTARDDYQRANCLDAPLHGQ